MESNFLKILAEFTAGDPMREDVLWTNLSRSEISRRLREMGTPASRHVGVDRHLCNREKMR